MIRLLLLALLVAGTASCASLSGGITASDPFQSSAERRLSIRIENLGPGEASVRALAPGRRTEIGRVRERTVQQYSVPWSRTQEVRFQIEVTGGRRHTTLGVVVGPGELVHLVVADPVARSFIRR